MSFKEIFADVSKTTNELFGETCALYIDDPYGEANLLLPSISVVVDKSKQVKGEFNNIVGYRTAAKILKVDMPSVPRGTSLLRDASGTVWELGEIVEQNKSAWWLDCMSTSTRFPDDLEPQPNFSTSINDLVVDFTNLTSVDEPLINSWLWDFGDGQTSTEVNPQHTYVEHVLHTVSLSATSTTGYTSTFTTDITL
jgi:PKD repeat protein